MTTKYIPTHGFIVIWKQTKLNILRTKVPNLLVIFGGS